MFEKIRGPVLLFVLAFMVSSSAYAKNLKPRLLLESGDWKAYMLTENGHKVCYMVSQPKQEEGNYKRRGDIYALVTHRPSENTMDVFSYVAGYSYQNGSSVTVSFGGRSFKLFTQGETAWAEDAATDKKIAAAIRSGSNMIVKGTSSRGTPTKDTFSLKGSGAAYKAISKECGA